MSISYSWGITVLLLGNCYMSWFYWHTILPSLPNLLICVDSRVLILMTFTACQDLKFSLYSFTPLDLFPLGLLRSCRRI